MRSRSEAPAAARRSGDSESGEPASSSSSSSLGVAASTSRYSPRRWRESTQIRAPAGSAARSGATASGETAP